MVIHTDVQERDAKRTRITRILESRRADAVHLTSAASLAWLTCGARPAVPLGGAPVFAATVTRSGDVTVRALANEAERLANEEIAGDVSWSVVPWQASLTDLPDGAIAESAIAECLRAARACLLPEERERYCALGFDTARAMTRILESAEPSWTERRLAGHLARAAYEIGAEPAVVLAAGESRASVQHPVPTSALLGRRAMAVVTTVRDGLHASMTRWVQFGADKEPRQAETRLREVEADIFEATRTGRPLADVFGDIRAAYARHGFGNDAWIRHHQGGPTGYVGRDPKLAPGIGGVVAEGQAFAWNPSVPQAKLEDTVISSANGIEVLTHDPSWPTTNVRGLARPLTLIRK